MKKKNFRFSLTASSILTTTVIFYAFIIPILPSYWEKFPARLGIVLIFISGVLSIDRKKRYMLAFAMGTFALEILSMMYDLWVLNVVSKSLNISFFLVVVFNLIRQIATSDEVTPKEILESISGYILTGIVYSVLISFIMNMDPGAYNVAPASTDLHKAYLNLSTSMYYSFVTMASVGYGDIVPIKPYTRSLATFIGISGQLYIAILISMLVGKYLSRRPKSSGDKE
jgi:voltage-gated potassium channel